MKTTIRRALLSGLALLFVAVTASALTPVNGHWWNPNESGTGYNIDVNSGGVMVLTVYSYKTTGDSEWYLAVGTLSVDGKFTATLDKYRNGQCISCAYSGRPTAVGNDGSVSITFLNETSAILTLPGGRVTSIQPFFPPPAASSNGLNGTYRLARTTIDYLDGALFDTALGNLIVTGTMVISGNQATQTLHVTFEGVTSTLNAFATFVDHGAYLTVTSNDATYRVTLIVRNGSTLALETVNPAVAGIPPYAQIEQWTLVKDAVASDKIVGATDQTSATPGFGVGRFLPTPKARQ